MKHLEQQTRKRDKKLSDKHKAGHHSQDGYRLKREHHSAEFCEDDLG